MRSDNWSVSLALSFLALAAMPASTDAVTRSVEPPAHGRVSSSSPWGVTRPTAAATTKTKGAIADLRGGGLFGGKKKSAAKIYRESLEEQVLLLNEQLGNARQEVTTLRENAKKRHRAGKSPHRVKQQAGVPSKAEQNALREYAKQQEKIERQREKEQKEALARLQSEIKQLEGMRAELETMLETSARKIETLEEQLALQDSLTAKMEVSHKEKIALLEQQLADVQTAQLEKLAEINQERVDAAVREALKAQEAEFLSRMEETTLRLTKEHARAMEQEKLRSSKAVETERKKMRKLVRALAMREKKLKLQAPAAAAAAKSSSKTAKDETIVIKTKSSSSQKKPFTAPTSRGTI